MTYEDIGNICYEHQQRIVKPEGLITTPNLVMKLYSMLPKGDSVDIIAANEFVQERIKQGEINHRSGMGFTIVSDGILNASVWGVEIPILPKNEVYSFEDGDIKTAKHLDLNEEGAYCALEAQIFGFEGLVWLAYLGSGKTEEDKITYLNSTFEGII